MRSRLRQLLHGKGFKIISGKPTDTVSDCVSLMLSERVGCLLIMQDNKIEGIFTERDLLTKVVPRRMDPSATPVSEVMNAKVVVVSPDATVEESMSIMTVKRIRHLPVMEGSNLIGLISIGDIAKWLSDQYRTYNQEIDDLVRYINGNYSA